MNKLFALIAWLLLAGISSAAPYVVYSGTIAGTNLSAGGSTSADTTVYLVTDINNTVNFAVLLVDAAQKTYSVVGRPSDTPSSDESTTNFLGSIGTGRSAEAVLAYNITTTDSSNDTSVARAYATGSLDLSTVVLAAARKSLAVPIRTNRVVTGTYTFGATTAITTGGTPFATALTGSTSGYVINSSGDLTHATSPGSLSLRYSSSLTSLVNIGGAYSVSVETEFALMPITVPSGQSESDAFVAWLSAFAQANGWTLPSTNSNLTPDPFSGGVSIDGTLPFGGEINGGPSLAIAGSGTLTIDGTSIIVTDVNPGDVITGYTGTTGLLVLGGLGIVAATSTDALIFTPNGTSTLTLLDTGTLNLGGLTFTDGSSGPLIDLTGGGTLTLPSGTVTIANVAGSLGTGTLTVPAIGQQSASLDFSNTTVSFNGSTNLSIVTPSTVITGAISLSGGTAAQAGAYTSGTLTISGGTLINGNFTSTDLPSPSESGTFTGITDAYSGYVTLTTLNTDGTYDGTISSASDPSTPVYYFIESTFDLDGQGSFTVPHTIDETNPPGIRIQGGNVSNSSGTTTFSGSELDLISLPREGGGG